MATQKETILQKIKEDKNSFLPSEIKKYLGNNTISDSDLLNIGIPQIIIENCKNYTAQKLDDSKAGCNGEIPSGYTEVLLWGIPSSGKTCAISGILNYLNKSKQLQFNKIDSNNGKKYADDLKQIFLTVEDKLIGKFPDGTTNENSIIFIPLYPNREKKIALIDLSGECVNKIVEQNYINMNILKKILDGDNRKFHFFFIEYTNDPQKIDVQQRKLQDLSDIFEQQNFFKNTTDYIYIVVTKSDIIDANRNRQTIVQNFINNNYGSFVENISKICKPNYINIKNGKVNINDFIIDFSLGDVFFKFLCIYKQDSSKTIADIILQNVDKEKKDIYGNLYKWMDKTIIKIN